MFVRLAKVKDCQEIYDLIKDADSGMTTLPKSKDEVSKRIAWSKKSLNKKVKKPNKDSYLFVLKENNKIVGISAIYTSVSKNGESVFFKRKKKNIVSKTLKFKKTIDVIQLHTVKKPYTELGTLYLHPKFRGKGRGSLLSLARFKFMALWPERFDKKVFAEIRGKADKEDNSIFWKYFSRHFFDENIFNNNEISYINNSFISETIPKHQLLVDPLNKLAKSIIGVPHDNALPAYKMMRSQNFRLNDLVDIIDAGPCLECNLSKIKTIQNNKSVHIRSFGLPEKQIKGLVSNTDLKGFRVTRSEFSFDGERISIHRNLIKTLKLGKDSKVAFDA
tara:strand:- start:54 stop:1052 length:999 start_codon:yes stop_codon:yes gene_type:complete